MNKPCCGKRGSVALAEIIERGVSDGSIALEMERICCFNKRHIGSNMRIAPGGKFIHRVRPEDVPEILARLETTVGRVDREHGDKGGLIYPGA